MKSHEQLLKEANELLRSAYAISLRKGDMTNWEAFRNSVENMLIEQSVRLNNTSYQPAATCTARTYKNCSSLGNQCEI